MYYSNRICWQWRTKICNTDAKIYVPGVTLTAPDNTKLLHQYKTGFQRTIKWNKYQSEQRAYENIRKIATDHTAGWWLDYNYFENYYKMIAIDLWKQQPLDAHPRAKSKSILMQI